MTLDLSELEVQALRKAFSMYQEAKRREAAHNTDSSKSKQYATVLGTIETLQTKIGYVEDSK